MVAVTTHYAGKNPYTIQTVTVTADGETTVIPAGMGIVAVFIRNTTANAITGGLNIGTSAAGTQVVNALAVGASAKIGVPDAALLLKYFSHTAPQTLHYSAVTSFNSASLNVTYVLANVPN